MDKEIKIKFSVLITIQAHQFWTIHSKFSFKWVDASETNQRHNPTTNYNKTVCSSYNIALPQNKAPLKEQLDEVRREYSSESTNEFVNLAREVSSTEEFKARRRQSINEAFNFFLSTPNPQILNKLIKDQENRDNAQRSSFETFNHPNSAILNNPS